MFLESMYAKAVTLDPGLYIVATPLGNARDITLRALDVLTGADIILCEDTRISAKLMQLYGITTKRMAYHEHNAPAMRPRILDWLAEGKVLALISDAGTPLISDPGLPLVRAARDAGHYVTAVPGASAPIAALSIAGLPTDRFLFAGFLPPKQAARRRALAELAVVPACLVFFESAKRLSAFLADMNTVLPERLICAARELTKKFEEVTSGTAAELSAHFEAHAPRGEFVIMVAPGAAKAASVDDVVAMLADALQTMSRRDAVQAVAAMSGRPRKEVYAQALALDTGAPMDDNKKNDNPDDPSSIRQDG